MEYNTGDKYLELALFPDGSVMVYDRVANSALDEAITKLGYTISYNKTYRSLSYVIDGDKEKCLETVALYEEILSKTLCKHCNGKTEMLTTGKTSDSCYYGCRTCNKMYIYKVSSKDKEFISFTEVLTAKLDSYLLDEDKEKE